MFVNAGMSLAVTQPVANHDQPTINPIKSSSEDGLVKSQILLKIHFIPELSGTTGAGISAPAP